MDHDPLDPAFKRAFAAEFSDGTEYFDETVLHDILGINAVFAVTHTNAEHNGSINLVELAVSLTLTVNASFYDMLFGIHPILPYLNKTEAFEKGCPEMRRKIKKK